MEEQGRWTNAGSLTPGRGRQQVLENEAKKRKTRRELFLKRMEGLIHWQRLVERILSFCPKARKGPPTLSAGSGAANSLHAIGLQSQRPWYGGPRFREGRLCSTRPNR